MAHHMFQTAEIRWFFKGDIPKEILDWFYDTGFEPDKQAQRTDYYLILPDNDSLGIKLREGSLEFKQRFGKSEEFIFDNSIGGYLEYWQKWSFELTDYPAVINDIPTYPESWIGVVKERSLQMFGISEDGKIFQSPTGVFLHNGCGWELTKIQIKGRNEKWWSSSISHAPLLLHAYFLSGHNWCLKISPGTKRHSLLLLFISLTIP